MATKLTIKSGMYSGGMRQTHMDTTAATAMWTALDSAIDAIFTQKTSLLSFNELYNYGYQLTIHKHGDLLYNGVAASVRAHLKTTLQNVVAPAPNETLLQVCKTAWDEFKVTANNLKDILMYLDRTYVSQYKKTPVNVVMVQIFREVVVLNPDVAGRLRSLMLETVLKERQGNMIDRDLMKAVLRMLVDIGLDGQDVYEDFFEAPFLSATRSHYKQLSQEYLSQNTCPDYMRMADKCLADEAERVVNYLSRGSEPKLRQVCEVELVQEHAKTLIEMETSGCLSMFEENKVDDLARMYGLFVRLPNTLDLLRDFMGSYVKQCGSKIVTDQETNKDPLVFVRQMLDLKSMMDQIIDLSFRNEKRFQKKLQEAFEEFVNKDSRCAAHLASFVDDLLKGGLRECTEDAADEQLNRVIVIFRYLTDKDIFETFYKAHLSKRLLGGKSVSDELERSMVSKLKVECGYQFTSKLEGMFKDMALSKGVQEDFRRSAVYAQLPLEMEVQLLSTGNWPLPSTRSAPPRLPAQAQTCCDLFAAFYLTRNDGCKLTWFPHLGSADVKVSPPALLPLLFFYFTLLLSFSHTLSPVLLSLATGLLPPRLARFERVDVPNVHPHGLQRHDQPLALAPLLLLLLLLLLIVWLCKPAGALAELRRPHDAVRRRGPQGAAAARAGPLHQAQGAAARGHGQARQRGRHVYRQRRLQVQVQAHQGAHRQRQGERRRQRGGRGRRSGRRRRQRRRRRRSLGQRPAPSRRGRAQAHDRGGHCPRDEDAQDVFPQRPRGRGHQAALVPLQRATTGEFFVSSACVCVAPLSFALLTPSPLPPPLCPHPQFIKKRIESLIEREYLKRDSNDARIYIYMA